MSDEQLYGELISNLERIFGSFNKDQKKFEKASNSKIARDLCYSDSQFSRLINNSATDGEYQRAIQNTMRAIREIQLEKLAEDQSSPGILGAATPTIYSRKVFFSAICTTTILTLLMVWFFTDSWTPPQNTLSSADINNEMLKLYFENSSVSPYTGLNDMPENCSYSCYRYQGQWTLKTPYKIPVFRERNGFHYLAKDVNLYMRCLPESERNGKTLEGYEYQNHELWYDKRELQFDSFVLEEDPSEKTDAYKQLDFEEDNNFVKIAIVHTFFRNEFSVDSTSIERNGMVIGRNVDILDDEILLNELGTQERVNDIKGEINSIIVNRLEDFSRPISCKNSQVPDTNYHNIEERDTISFDCELTTANAPIKYTKTYVLNDQYVETSCRTNL